MTKQTEALKLALEALKKSRDRIVEQGGSGWKLHAQQCVNAITAIREALADSQDANKQQQGDASVADWDAWNKCSLLNSALQEIGDFAHDKSTGPAVPDALWEIRSMAYDAMKDTSPLAQRKPLTEEQIVASARVLNQRMAEQCGVDADDQWALYADDFKADARAVLEAAHGITKE